MPHTCFWDLNKLLTGINMKFLEKFRKDVSKEDGINLDIIDPTFWIGSGNYIINKILSGKYQKAFPQGRISAITGPSAAGKTFVASNVAREALENEIGVLYIDTENAIDNGHLKSMGIDPDHPLLQYADCSTLTQCIFIVSSFIKAYRESGETHKFLIIIDSLDMLQTDSDAEKYDKNTIGGDQGQWAKQCKKMLGAFVQDLKRVNIHMLCTKQVYANQDPIDSKQNPWKFTDSLKFAFSQILVVSRLLLKDKDTNTFNGIKLQAFEFKTRLTQPFQKCKIEVPYETGMDKYTGTLEAASGLGIVEKNGGWYTFKGEKFQEHRWKKDDAFKELIFQELLKHESENLFIQGEDEELDMSEAEKPEDVAKRRKARAAAAAKDSESSDV